MNNKFKTLIKTCFLLGLTNAAVAQSDTTTMKNFEIDNTIDVQSNIKKENLGVNEAGFFYSLPYGGVIGRYNFSRPELTSKFFNRVVPKDFNSWLPLSTGEFITDNPILTCTNTGQKAPYVYWTPSATGQYFGGLTLDLTNNTGYRAPENANLIQKISERAVPGKITTRLSTFMGYTPFLNENNTIEYKDRKRFFRTTFMPSWNTSINANRLTQGLLPSNVSPWISHNGNIDIVEANFRTSRLLNEEQMRTGLPAFLPDVDLLFNTRDVKKTHFAEAWLNFNTGYLKNQIPGRTVPGKVLKHIIPCKFTYTVGKEGEFVGVGLSYSRVSKGKDHRKEQRALRMQALDKMFEDAEKKKTEKRALKQEQKEQRQAERESRRRNRQ